MKRVGEIECRIHENNNIIKAEILKVVCDINHPSLWLDEAEEQYEAWKYKQFDMYNFNPTNVKFSYTVTKRSQPVE